MPKFGVGPMISPYKTRIRSDKIWSQIASILVALMGCLVLLGWLLDLPLLKSVLLSLPATKPNSAVAFVLIGAALWIETDERAGPRARRLGLLCALVVVGIGLLTLSEYLFGWNIGIDQLLFRDTAPGTDYSVPGRIAEATALSFILLGTALGLVKNAQRLILAQVLTLIVIAIALLSLAGYLYAGVSLYGLLSYPATAFALVISSIGLLLVRPDRGLMAVTSGDNPGAILARRLLPAVILIPLIFGWLELTAEQQGWVPLGFGPAIDIVAHIVTFGLLVWWNAALLHRASIEHKRAEEDRRALAAIVESSDDAIIGKTLDGTITSWNKGAKALYGYTAEEAKGKSVDLLMPSDRPDDFPMLMEKIRNGESIARYETVRQRKDGTRVDVSLTVSAIRDINRNVVGASAIARDITERKRADDALKRYAERLEILRDIDLGILRGGSMLSLVETTLKNIRQIVPCQRARVALIDEATNEALVFDLDYD